MEQASANPIEETSEENYKVTSDTGETIWYRFYSLEEFAFSKVLRGLVAMGKKGEYFNFFQCWMHVVAIGFSIGFPIFLFYLLGRVKDDYFWIGVGVISVISLGCALLLKKHIEMLLWPRTRVIKDLLAFNRDELTKKLDHFPFYDFMGEKCFICIRRAEAVRIIRDYKENPPRTPLDLLLKACIWVGLLAGIAHALSLAFGWATSLSTNTLLVIIIILLLVMGRNQRA